MLKIDLEKAFDSIKWSFIERMLEFYRFPQSLKDLIMNYIFSTLISILLNGGKLECFKPTKGIR